MPAPDACPLMPDTVKKVGRSDMFRSAAPGFGPSLVLDSRDVDQAICGRSMADRALGADFEVKVVMVRGVVIGRQHDGEAFARAGADQPQEIAFCRGAV